MRFLNNSPKKILAGAAAAAIVAGGGSAAFAYWTTSGTGTGVASTQETVASWAIAQSTVFGSNTGNATPLYPGASQGLAGTVKNADTNAPAKLRTLTVKLSVPTTTGCTAADYAFSTTSPDWVVSQTSGTPGDTAVLSVPSGGVELQKATATGDTFNWSGVNITMVDAAGNQDACKAVTPTFAYSAG